MSRCSPDKFSDLENKLFDKMMEREEVVNQLNEAKKEYERLKKLKKQYTIKAICKSLGVQHWQVIKVWY